MDQQAKQFLDALFAGKEPGEFCLVWLLEGRRSAWFTDTAAAAAYIEANCGRDVYIGVALSPADHGPSLRLKIEGGERLPSSLVGLYADIDILDPTHGKKNLPPDEASARSILFPDIPPSILIHSGGGLQAWWIFKEPWVLESEAEVQKAGALSKRWIRALRARAAARGWDVDQVGDLTRVLRIPGTSNCKIPGQPRPVVIRELNDRRYNPSDLEDFLDSIGASKLETPNVRGIVIGQLVYDPNANYDSNKFNLLAAVEPKFQQTWYHKRAVRELPDQSASAYDQALANFTAQAGWTDQEIANLLIAHRRTYNFDLKLRDSYYVATIRKARELYGEAQVWSNIDELIAQHDAREKAPPTQAQTDAPQESKPAPKVAPEVIKEQEALAALDEVSEEIGIKIIQIYKYIEDQPTYRMKCERGETGEIDMGNVQSLTEQRIFRDKVAALTNHRIPTFKQPQWDKLSFLLLSSVTPMPLGPEANAEGMVRSWLDQYFEGLAIQDSIEEADQTKGPFTKDGHVCFFLQSFQKWSTTNHGADRFTTPGLLKVFDRLGIVSRPVHLGRSSRYIYRMPSGYVAPRAVRKGQTADLPDLPDLVKEDQPEAIN